VRTWLVSVAMAAALLTTATSAHAEWRRAESEHFIVYGRKDSVVREYVSMLEDFDGLLRRLHGRPKDEVTPRKLPVYIVSNLGELQRVQPSLTQVGGVYFPAPAETFVVAIRDSVSSENDQNRGDDAVLHEYVHHFMLRYYPSAYPAWLVEGYAEYYMTVDLGAKRMIVGGVNQGRIRNLSDLGSWIPIEDVLTKTTRELKRDDGAAYYAEAWLLTHYLLSNPERYKLLPVYLRDARTSKDPVGAWKRVYGDNPIALRNKLQDYVRRSIPGIVLPREGSAEPAMTITTLPPSADNLLLEGQRIKLGVAPDDRAAFMDTLHKQAAKAPKDRFGQLVVARAETRFGDRAAGEAILNGLLDADPNDEDALIYLGESKLAAGAADASQRAAEFAEATKLFARAFKIDPDNPSVLRGYADSRALEPLTENVVNVRLRAVEMAPEVGAFRIEAARVLIATKDPRTAKAVLAPLAASPHGGSMVETAQAMVRVIDAEAEKAAAGAGQINGKGDKKG